MFLDFDSTLVGSIDAYCKTYNHTYKHHPKFTPANPSRVNEYSMRDECPLQDNPLDIFDTQMFFDELDFIEDDTLEIVKELNNVYQIIIVTIGTPRNLSNKIDFIGRHLPFIDNYILLRHKGCKMDKSSVNMFGKGNIIIDDVPSNLYSSNAESKILFGKRYSWNEDWEGEHCINWKEVKKRLL